MFCMLMLTVPPAVVAAVLVPTGALVAGAGWLEEDLSLLLPPHPATPTTTKSARRKGFMGRTLPIGRGGLSELRHDGCVIGQRAAVDHPRAAEWLEAAGQDVVDPVSAG